VAGLGPEAAQGGAGLGETLAAIVHDAPDVAEQGVIGFGDFGKAMRKDRRGHGWRVAAAARGVNLASGQRTNLAPVSATRVRPATTPATTVPQDPPRSAVSGTRSAIAAQS
jgi:hypothetical protein